MKGTLKKEGKQHIQNLRGKILQLCSRGCPSDQFYASGAMKLCRSADLGRRGSSEYVEVRARQPVLAHLVRSYET